jgi:hypothetical protein
MGRQNGNRCENAPKHALNRRQPSWVGVLLRAGLCTLSACSPALAPPAGPGEHVGDHCERSADCGDGLSCHYEGSPAAPRNACRLDVGRCRFDHDCGPQQMACRRFGVRLGVCEQAQ